ncbi:MAG TPA: hypothetical protein VIK11_13330 [Tepidiformaceae bacterium]
MNLLLSGTSASGKNTIGAALAGRVKPCAVIDFDMVRLMFANPHLTPWQGDQGYAQQLMGVRMVSSLASQFQTMGWHTVILDVLWCESPVLYRELLGDRLTIVSLLPAFEETVRRSGEREAREGYRRLTAAELRLVYDEHASVSDYDLRIDNTNIPAVEVAEEILRRFIAVEDR